MAKVGRCEKKHTAELRERLLPPPQEPGTQHSFLNDDSVRELRGSRPDHLAGVRPQDRVALWPDVEQVIEVPENILHLLPQRSPFLEPQVVEQLVEVLDWVALAHGVDAAGTVWCQPLAVGKGSAGGGVAPATSSGPPSGVHRQPRAGHEASSRSRRLTSL